eukprot:jgi/Botrbrau1/17147/Bobra.0157s0042.2
MSLHKVIVNLLFFITKPLRPFYINSWSPLVPGLAYLSALRQELVELHIYDTNGPDTMRYPGVCGSNETRFRTYEGHCNAINIPPGTIPGQVTNMGAKDTRFMFFHEPAPPDTELLFDPIPYTVAKKMVRGGKQQLADIMNLLAAGWIQFNIHDWMNHTSDFTRPPYKLQVGENSFHDLPPTSRDRLGYTTNQMTHWWDASNIYGPSKSFAYSLRDDGACEIKLDEKGNLRLDEEGVPIGGASHNWWLGMEIFHFTFVKEHNSLCEALRAEYGDKYDEDTLFEFARHVVIALIAKIHTIEWTPALLQNQLLNASMHVNWEGYTKGLNDVLYSAYEDSPDFLVRLGVSAGKALNGVVGKVFELVGLPTTGTQDKRFFFGTGHQFSEEFVTSYRMHSLLLDVNIIDKKPVKLVDQIFEKAREVVDEFGWEKIIRSFGQSKMGTLTWGNYPDTLGQVKLPWQQPGEFLNMAAIDIFRDRERGTPRYNDFREELLLPRAETWADINPDPAVQQALKEVYGGDIDKVDAVAGLMAEMPRPKNYAISDTAFRVFVIMASRRIVCDR